VVRSSKFVRGVTFPLHGKYHFSVKRKGIERDPTYLEGVEKLVSRTSSSTETYDSLG
jgi:hypothetical protein